jgi:hypothetical protein
MPVELADDQDATLADRNEGLAKSRLFAVCSGEAVIGVHVLGIGVEQVASVTLLDEILARSRDAGLSNERATAVALRGP